MPGQRVERADHFRATVAAANFDLSRCTRKQAGQRRRQRHPNRHQPSTTKVSTDTTVGAVRPPRASCRPRRRWRTGCHRWCRTDAAGSSVGGQRLAQDGEVGAILGQPLDLRRF